LDPKLGRWRDKGRHRLLALLRARRDPKLALRSALVAGVVVMNCLPVSMFASTKC
jgi:hypothetical protein